MHTVLIVFAILGAVFVGFIVISLIGRQQYGWTAANTILSAKQAADAPYWYRLLVASDLFANVALRGKFGMTLSTRIAIWAAMRRKGPVGWFVGRLLKALDTIQPDHGTGAMAGDIARNTIGSMLIEPWLDAQTVAAVQRASTLQAAAVHLTRFKAA